MQPTALAAMRHRTSAAALTAAGMQLDLLRIARDRA
jgi:hypothetical protein